MKGSAIAARETRRDRRPLSWDMALFTVAEILEVTGGRLLAGDDKHPRAGARRLSTDSREVGRGDLFIPLRGDRFDGHQFVAAAVRDGAAGVLIALDAWPDLRTKLAKSEAFVIGVGDPLLGYQQLAAHHRRRFEIPIIAVTGSNGKTTTKEMTAQVLSERWKILKTEGNLNNRIGVPQTLLRLTARHQAAVIEMGVDQKGQTTRLTEIARPTVGLITNIGPDHLEFFGTLEVSAQAKGELLDLLPEDGAAVLNADDPYFGYLASRARCRVVSFGLGRSADVRADNVVADGRRGVRFDLTLPGKARPTAVALPAHGAHNLINALAAAAVGLVCDISGARIARGLSRFRPAAMRSQVETIGAVTVINDCYNANPASMDAAVQLLAELGSARRTIAVLGDMLELGPTAAALHREVGAHLASRGINHLIAAGTLGRDLAAGARSTGMASDSIQEVPDGDAAARALLRMVKPEDVVLIKASRGMHLEQVVEALKSRR